LFVIERDTANRSGSNFNQQALQVSKKLDQISKMPSLHLMFHLRCLAQVILIISVLFLAFCDLTSAMSKKFLKGFLLGAYMAKHHEPVVVVEKKHG